MKEIEEKLRAALAGTSEAEPRPLTPLELPLRLDRLLLPRLLGSLHRAAVLVPVVRRPQGLQVLLTVRSETLRSHKGQVSFPGGRREASDASAAAAALREAEEEVGIPAAAVEVVGYLDDYPTLTGYLVTPVVGLVEDVAAFRPCEREVAAVFEVPLAMVLGEANFQKKSLLRDGLPVPFYELNFGSYRIWGATAGMLWNLQQKVSSHG